MNKTFFPAMFLWVGIISTSNDPGYLRKEILFIRLLGFVFVWVGLSILMRKK